MFARYSSFILEAGRTEEKEHAFADAMAKTLRTLPGFHSIVFFGDPWEQHALSLWDTRDAAEAAGYAIGGWLQSEGSAYLRITESPMIRIVPAYVPE
jgi:hypothetical protein